MTFGWPGEPPGRLRGVTLGTGGGQGGYLEAPYAGGGKSWQVLARRGKSWQVREVYGISRWRC